MIQLRCIPP